MPHPATRAFHRAGSPTVAAKVVRANVVGSASLKQVRQLTAKLAEWSWAPGTTELLLRNIAQVLAALAWLRAGFAALALEALGAGDDLDVDRDDVHELPPPAPPPLAGAATIAAP
jgi:hypothetical protein